MIADGWACFADANFSDRVFQRGTFDAAGVVGGDCERAGTNGDSLREPKQSGAT